MIEKDKHDLDNNGELSANELLKLLKANLNDGNPEKTDDSQENIVNVESVEDCSSADNNSEKENSEDSEHINKPKKYKITKKIVKESNLGIEKAEEADKAENVYFDDSKTIEIGAVQKNDTPESDNYEEKIVEEAENGFFLSNDEDKKDDYGEEKKGEFDSADINLMMALGLEDELQQTVGFDKIAEVEASNELCANEDAKPQMIKQNNDFKNKEYENYEQSKEVFENYKNLFSNIKLRLIGTLMFALCIFIFENLPLVGIKLSGIFNYSAYPSTHIFLSLQLLLLCAALSYKELFFGIKDIIAFDFSSYSIAALAVAFTGICDLTVGFFGDGKLLNLYNFAAAFYLVLCVFCEYLNAKRELYNLKVISANRPKYAVISSTNKKMADSNFLEEEITTDLRVKKADFIGGFFERIKSRSEDNVILSYFAVASLAVSVIFAIIAYTNSKSINVGVAVANLTALMCLPGSMFAAYTLPPLICVKKAFSTKSTIIGDVSSKEYSGASCVIFDDKDVFPSRSVKIKSVKVYEDTRIDTVLSDISSVFAKLGGPVGEVLGHATAEIEHSSNVKITEVTECGISAEIDSDMRMLVGKTEYMAQFNIVPEYDYEDEIQLASGNVRIMHVAYGDRICAKLYIQYSIEAGFDNIVRQFNKSGTQVIIKTFDPNIDNNLLISAIPNVKSSAIIERYELDCIDVPQEEKTYSGIVSLSSIKSVAKTILLCDKLSHVKATSNIVKYMSVIVGFIIMLIFTLSNSSSLLLSMFVAIYHLFWVLPVFIVSKIYLN